MIVILISGILGLFLLFAFVSYLYLSGHFLPRLNYSITGVNPAAAHILATIAR